MHLISTEFLSYLGLHITPFLFLCFYTFQPNLITQAFLISSWLYCSVLKSRCHCIFFHCSPSSEGSLLVRFNIVPLLWIISVSWSINKMLHFVLKLPTVKSNRLHKHKHKHLYIMHTWKENGMLHRINSHIRAERLVTCII